MSNAISNQNPDGTTNDTGEVTAVKTPAVEAAPSTAMAAAWANRKPLKPRGGNKDTTTPAAVVSAKPAPAADVTPTAVVSAEPAPAADVTPTTVVSAEPAPATDVTVTPETTVAELVGDQSAADQGSAGTQPEPTDGDGSAPQPAGDGELLCDQSAAYTGATAEPVKEPKNNPKAAPAVGDVVRGIITTKLSKQDDSREVFGALVTLGGGMKGLLHESQLNGSTREDRAARLKALKRGEEVTVKVVEIKDGPKEGRKRISLSERAVVEDRLSEGLEGSIFEGTVSGKAITHVFVTLPNGLRGLLHVTELNGSRPQRDARLAALQAGERVTVKVMKVKEDPKRLGKINISLSERAASSDRLIAELRGATVTGTVTGFLFSKENTEERIGVFAEIGNGHRGLVHVSQLAGDSRKEHDDRIKALAVGDTMKVEVIEIGVDTKRGDLRIALSEQGPARRAYLAELNADGDRAFKAPAVGRDEHGFKLQLQYGLVGFLSFDELGGLPADTVKRGNNVRVKVLSVDGDQVKLTRRGL